MQPARTPPVDDHDRRQSIARLPATGIAAALRTCFEPTPLPADMVRLLDRLR